MSVWAKVAAVLLLMAGAYAWGDHSGRQAGAIRVARVTTAQAKLAQGVAEKALIAERAARAAESAQAAAFAARDQQYQQDIRHANDDANRLAADLRAARQRLRAPWQCPSSVSGAAASAARPDAGADDRAASAGRIVGAAAACDAQVRGLQAILRFERGAQ